MRKDLAKGPKTTTGSSPVRRSHAGRKTTMDPRVMIALRVPTVAIRAERGESEAHAGGERKIQRVSWFCWRKCSQMSKPGGGRPRNITVG